MATKSFISFVLGAWILASGIISLADAGLQTTFLEDICSYKDSYSMVLNYKPSGVIMSVPFMRSNRRFNCRVTLYPKKGSSVVLSIYKYKVEPKDNLTIEDSDNHKIALLGKADFRNEKKSIISEGRITIDFQTTSIYDSEFQFTYTQVNDYPCMDNEFQCNNNKCILKEFACDGHNHCGDNSDQKNCAPRDWAKATPQSMRSYKSTSVAWLITIGVGAVLLAVVIIVFIVVLVKRGQCKKAAASPTVPPNNADVNTNLHSVSSSVPVHPQQLSPNNLQRATTAPQEPSAESRPSIFNQIRKSFRGQKNQKTGDSPQEGDRKETYQVPSMYPSLDQIPSAPELSGIVNPDFKIEE